MNETQLKIFVKILAETGSSRVGDYTYVTVRKGDSDVYALRRYYKGGYIQLFAGSIQDCIAAARDTVKMVYGME